MTTKKAATKKNSKPAVETLKKPLRSSSEPPEENICFVISPIGKEGTETYDKFKEVLDYIIKPAVETASMKLKVVRADDINRAGSFIKDILENILTSYVVVADLTNQNPNVFYELGVRHCLSPRTIMISQSVDFVPSDLREYRTIVYENSAKGSKLFQEKLHEFMDEIKNEPVRPDNPVLCHLPLLQEDRTQLLEEEVSRLQEELDAVLKRPTFKPTQINRDLTKSIDRILLLQNAEIKVYNPNFTRGTGENLKTYSLPKGQGNFKLYYVLDKNSTTINDFWYLSICEKECDIDEELADIRMLMETCSKGQNVVIKFIIATNSDLTDKKASINKALTHMKKFIPQDQRSYFKIELWDASGLKMKEKELGIRAEV